MNAWLTSVWQFWDSHGTRLLGVVGFLHNALASVLAVLDTLSPQAMKVWLAVNAIMGAAVYARGQVNARKAP